MEKKQQQKIGQIVYENSNFLCALARTKSANRRAKLLKRANSNHLLALAEICLNIVKQHFSLTARQRNRLMPYAEFIRRMSRARSERGARHLLATTQKGAGFGVGLFSALLTPILIALASRASAESK